MRGFVAMVTVTLRHLLGGKRMIALAMLAALPVVVAWFTSGTLTAAGVVATFHDVAAGMFAAAVPIVAMVLGAGALGDEARDGTLSFLLVRPRPRRVIAAAKLLAAWLAALALVVPAAALAGTVVVLRIGDPSLIVPTIVAVSLISLAYCSVFAIVGFLTNRAVLAGLVYLFVWENGITVGAPALANISLHRIGLSAYAGMRPDSSSALAEALGAVTPGAGGALVKAAVIATLAIAAGAALLRRRDLV